MSEKDQTEISGRGGFREGAGRPPGTPNRATSEAKARLSDLAREHTAAALAVLVDVAESGATDSARVAAAVALLDRGYGKPRQAMDLDATPAVERPTLIRIVAGDAD